MAAIVHSDKAQKAIKKIKGAMQDYPLGVEFGELMQKTGYAKSSLYNALSLVGAHKSDDGLWHLPHHNTSDAPVNEVTEDNLDDDLDDLATAINQPVKQDDGGNMQDNGGNMQDNGGNTQDAPVNIEDEELNTQAPHVSSPDNGEDTLINPSAGVANPSDIDTDADQQDTTEVGQIIVNSDDLHPDFLALPDHQPSNGQANETAPVAESEEEFELQPPPVATKHYVLIENCTLSLAKDEIGDRPSLAKSCWFDSYGNDIPLDSPDGQFLQKAVGGFSNEAIFRGEEYFRRYALQGQLFHGVFDSIQSAHAHIDFLIDKNPAAKTSLEVIEV